jgi:signal transduction histidine kinase
VFEPFFTTKQSGGEHGTGLGLTTVYAIARDAGWGLELETEPGRGTTFRVLLPAVDTAPMATGGRGLPIPPGTDSP